MPRPCSSRTLEPPSSAHTTSPGIEKPSCASRKGSRARSALAHPGRARTSAMVNAYRQADSRDTQCVAANAEGAEPHSTSHGGIHLASKSAPFDECAELAREP